MAVKRGKVIMSKEVKSFYTGSIAFVLFILLRGMIPLHNMEFYVAACAVFVSVSVLVYFLTGGGPAAEGKDGGDMEESGLKGAAERIWSISAAAVLVLWIILFYVNETNTEHPLEESVLIRRYFPFPLWISLMAAGTGLPAPSWQGGKGEDTGDQKKAPTDRIGSFYYWYLHYILCAQYFSGYSGRNLSQPRIYQQYY